MTIRQLVFYFPCKNELYLKFLDIVFIGQSVAVRVSLRDVSTLTLQSVSICVDSSRLESISLFLTPMIYFGLISPSILSFLMVVSPWCDRFLTIITSTLQRLQSNIADTWMYIRLCVACFAFIALVVSMLPLQLCVNSLPRKYRKSFDVLLSYYDDIICTSIDSLNLFHRGMLNYIYDFVVQKLSYFCMLHHMFKIQILVLLHRLLSYCAPRVRKILAIWIGISPIILYLSQSSLILLVLFYELVLLAIFYYMSIEVRVNKYVCSSRYAVLYCRFMKPVTGTIRRHRRRKNMFSGFFKSAAKYEPQSGYLLSAATKLIKEEVTDYVYTNQDQILREIEDIVLLFYRISDCKTWKGVMANIVSDVKKRFPASLSGIVLQCIDDLFCASKDFSTQAGDLACDERTWLQTLKDAHSNWELATNNEGFDKISRLMSILVGAGLIQMSSLQVDVGGLNLFSQLVVPKHVSAFDLADATLSTVIYFVEGGYECASAGSLDRKSVV